MQPWDIDAGLRPGAEPVRASGRSPPRTSARRTSTPSTRCPTRAGSPTGSTRAPMSIDESRARPEHDRRPGAGQMDGDSRRRRAGFAPGFTVRDRAGRRCGSSASTATGIPDAATGAIAVATRLFWALGYYQVESYLTTIAARERSIIGESATVTPPSGKRRPMHAGRLEEVFARAAPRAPTARIASLAGAAVPGQADRRIPVPRHPSGRSERHRAARAPPRAARAEGVRRVDEPRRHEGGQHARHRRSRRTAASRRPSLPAGCRLDLRHRRARAARVGRGLRVSLRGRHVWKRLVHAAASRSALADGRLTRSTPRSGGSRATSSSPRSGSRACRPRRVLRARADDTFWAARRVMAFSDELIRGDREDRRSITDPRRRAALLADVLIKRRDKIGRAYLTEDQPAGRVRARRRRHADVRERGGPGRSWPRAPARGYRAEWSTYDRAGGPLRSLGAATTSTTERMAPPAGLATAPASSWCSR